MLSLEGPDPLDEAGSRTMWEWRKQALARHGGSVQLAKGEGRASATPTSHKFSQIF